MRNLVMIALLLSACGPAAPPEKKKKLEQPLAACSRTPAVGDRIIGGCELRLVSPKNCEEIDLRNGKTYDFVWITDTGTCEVPLTLLIAGSPADLSTRFNLVTFGLNTLTAKISADHVKDLTTFDGTFEWGIADKNGAHPASRVFRIKR